MAGDAAYFYFGTGDPERAQQFFGDVLGWEFDEGSVEGGFNVSNVSPPGGMFGGENAPDGFRMYFTVPDLEAALEKITTSGGEADEPQPTHGGRFAECRDDQGMAFGIYASEE